MLPISDSKIVAFIQPFVPNYRAPLFNELSRRLEKAGLTLEIWHSRPVGDVALRGNAVVGAWSRTIRQRRITVRGRNFTMRSVLRRSRSARVVVAGLASTNIETFFLALDPKVRLLLWGHGKNYTGKSNYLDRCLEKWLCSRAEHIFTYTEQGCEFLVTIGVPAKKITVVRNSTDTVGLRAGQAQLDAARILEKAKQLSLTPGATGIFIGALDRPKELPFLSDAADIVAATNPDFRLLIVGAGALSDFVEEYAASREYVTYLGRLQGEDLALAGSVSDFLLMPGRVGLVAVDALALGLPVVTTLYPHHAPEVEYLDDSCSVRSAFSVAEYSEAVVNLIRSPHKLAELKAGAMVMGSQISLESSVDAFCTQLLKGTSDV